MEQSEVLLGLPEYQITKVDRKNGKVCLSVRYTGLVACPDCSSCRLRNKGRYLRRVRHENLGMRPCVLEVEAHKWQCRDCQRHFRQRFHDLALGKIDILEGVMEKIVECLLQALLPLRVRLFVD